jgi:signal transduction histidine kinase
MRRCEAARGYHPGMRHRWSRSQRFDVLLAAALTVTSVWEAVAFEEPTPSVPLIVLDAVAAAALAWRRSSPGLVAGLVAVCYAVPTLVGASPDNFSNALVSLIAAYSCALYGRDSKSYLGCAALAVPWAIRGYVANGQDIGAGVVEALWIGLATGVGAAVRRQVMMTDRAREQATRAVEDRDAASARAVAEERDRIARELHDVVSHAISVIILHARGGRRMLEVDLAESRAAFDTIDQVAEQALAEMRRLVGLLRTAQDTGGAGPGGHAGPQYAPQPSLRHLDLLIAQTAQPTTDVHVQVSGNLVDLPPGVDVTAYRIIQEALTNVRRHAHARNVRVSVDVQPDALDIEVLDDGRGSVGAAGTGFGIRGMQERAAVFGGTLTASPQPAGGFRVAAHLPISSVSEVSP